MIQTSYSQYENKYFVYSNSNEVEEWLSAHQIKYEISRPSKSSSSSDGICFYAELPPSISFTIDDHDKRLLFKLTFG